MNQREFHEWLSYHKAAFTGLQAWFDQKQADYDANAEGVPSVEDILRRWYYALKDISAQAATAATDAMFRGDVDVPKFFDEHARVIRRMAKSRDSNLVPQADPRCVCRGSCYVEVVNEIHVREEGKEDRIERFKTALGNEIKAPTVLVSCMCPAAQWRNDRRKPPLPVYDPDKRIGGHEIPVFRPAVGTVQQTLYGESYSDALTRISESFGEF